MVGNILKSAEQPYWETAQGITTTVATVDLISGIQEGTIFLGEGTVQSKILEPLGLN